MALISPIYGMGGKKKKKKKARGPSFGTGEPPKYTVGMKKNFYLTREWRTLRWQVLQESDGLCVVCGRGKKNGVVLHVDHIKPRSRFPYLELYKPNMQVLCEDCNLGKGAS